MRSRVLLAASVLLVFLPSAPMMAQTQGVSVSTPIEQRLDVRFRLFPTRNIWTFLLLDTANGRVWQVHYAVDDSSFAGRLSINERSLTLEADSMPGRFTLYATHNIYSFLLLDQEDGRAWQVQWSFDRAGRGIMRDLSSGRE